MDTPPPEAAITAIVLTLNEAAHIVPCLRTVQWADEMLVIDSGSTDATVALAESQGARVVARPWDNWANQRNFGAAQASHPWVCFVDADERVSLELATEIRARTAAASRGGPRPAGPSAGQPAGFWVPRQNLLFGQWMKHAGWYPDYQLRVFRRDRGGYDPQRPVHELVQLDGPTDYLTNHLIHHNYTNWPQFWWKQRRYARAEAAAQFARGRRARPHNFVLQPLREFRRRYWTLAGYRAGMTGLGVSLLLAAADFVMHAELWRLARRARRELQEGRAGD